MTGAVRAASVAAIVLIAGCTVASPAPEKAPPAAIVAGWPQIPAGARFGQVSAVDVDAKGRVFVLHRAGRAWSEPFPQQPIAEPTVFVFDGRTGRLLARWGAGQFIMPHGLSIDPQGRVWITDAAREQVMRFSPDGRLELTLGERGVSGSDAGHFGRPTDIAFANGEVFIADGYVNHRIAVFSPDGRFLRQWGEAGDGAAGLETPHAIAIAEGRVFVADRENGRIRVSDLRGVPAGSWSPPGGGGHPYSLKPLPGGGLVSVEGRDRADRSGALLRIWRKDGTLAGSLDAALSGEGASLGHDIARAPNGTIYLADVYGDRVVKLRLEQGANH